MGGGGRMGVCECGIFADLLISICRWSYSIVGVALGVTFGWRGAFGWGWSIWVWQLHVNHVLSPQSTQPKPS